MNVGICGAGTMGRGIALNALLSKHTVCLADIQSEVLEQARQWIEKQLTSAVEKKRIKTKDAEAARSCVSYSTSLESLADCNIIIEAVVEKVEIKNTVLAALEKVMHSDAVLATNTSSISIASLARPLVDPTRFAGLHFFNPAHIMKLVEVIQSPRTSNATLNVCIDFAKSLGKSPVVARDVPGFIVNRIARNFYNEAQRIVMEGAASVEQVDRSVKGLGFRMGPFELMDLIGVGTNLDVTTSQWEQFYLEPRFQPSLLQKQMVDAGMKFGDKS